MKKNIDYYLDLPYSISIQRREDEDGVCYVGKVLELDGCHSHGATKNEAFANLQEAMAGYLEVKLEYGDFIPEPVKADGFSGKILLRLPKSLHQRLFYEADKEGVSLNQYALHKLSC